jgi:hypothetical protein
MRGVPFMSDRSQLSKKNHKKTLDRIESASYILPAVACALLRLPLWGLAVVILAWGTLVDAAMLMLRRRVLHESPENDDVEAALPIRAIIRAARRCGDEALAQRIEKLAKEHNIKKVPVTFTVLQLRQLRAVRRDKTAAIGVLRQIADNLDVAKDHPMRFPIYADR